MRRYGRMFADSAPANAATPDPEGAAAPQTGPDRRGFICSAMLVGSVVAIGWPAFADDAEADWSDGTGWSDRRGWSS